MTKTSPTRIPPVALLLPLFLGMIAFASVRPGADASTTNAFATQNTNKSATKSAKKSSTKIDCSKADDAALATQIKERHTKRSALKDEKEINVDVKAGVATLSGKVGSRSHKVYAVAEAKKVKCVKSVVNNLTATCKSCTQFCCDGVCQSTQCADEKKKPK